MACLESRFLWNEIKKGTLWSIPSPAGYLFWSKSNGPFSLRSMFGCRRFVTIFWSLPPSLFFVSFSRLQMVLRGSRAPTPRPPWKVNTPQCLKRCSLQEASLRRGLWGGFTWCISGPSAIYCFNISIKMAFKNGKMGTTEQIIPEPTPLRARGSVDRTFSFLAYLRDCWHLSKHAACLSR